jgi:hypothetical protein
MTPKPQTFWAVVVNGKVKFVSLHKDEVEYEANLWNGKIVLQPVLKSLCYIKTI